MLGGEPGYEHHVVHGDDTTVCFLAKYPVMRGHLLAAPVEHREHVVGDVDVDEYLRLQRVIHRAGVAVSAVVPTERVDVLSLGS